MLARGRLPAWLGRTRTVLAPHAAVAHEPQRWAGALVIVERGLVELEAFTGERIRLDRGAVLWLGGLSLRALHNPGLRPTTLVAIARRGTYGEDRPSEDQERRETTR